jgi:hypothetical protein
MPAEFADKDALKLFDNRESVGSKVSRVGLAA